MVAAAQSVPAHCGFYWPPALTTVPGCTQVEPRWMKYILAKGFIAVDGISLTVQCSLLFSALCSSTSRKEQKGRACCGRSGKWAGTGSRCT